MLLSAIGCAEQLGSDTDQRAQSMTCPFAQSIRLQIARTLCQRLNVDAEATH